MAKKVSSRKSSETKKAVKKAAKKTVKKTVKKMAKRSAKKTVKKAAKKVARKTSAPKATPRKVRQKCPLTKTQLAKYRLMLLEKRRGLIGDMNGIEAEALGHNGGGDLSNMPTHPADIGTDNFEHEFSLGLLESERSLLSEIDDALVRIGDKTYGICLGMGKPIGIARLNARPWSKYCIEYARMVEQGLARPGQEDEALDQ